MYRIKFCVTDSIVVYYVATLQFLPSKSLYYDICCAFSKDYSLLPFRSGIFYLEDLSDPFHPKDMDSFKLSCEYLSLLNFISSNDEK